MIRCKSVKVLPTYNIHTCTRQVGDALPNCCTCAHEDGSESRVTPSHLVTLTMFIRNVFDSLHQALEVVVQSAVQGLSATAAASVSVATTATKTAETEIDQGSRASPQPKQ